MSSAKTSAKDVEQALRELGSPKRAKASAWFFKTGPGEYGEGDRFFGVSVPEQRRIAKRFVDLSLVEIDRLLRNPFHEFRLTALLILVLRYEHAERGERARIAAFYLKNAKRVNNWDLVDSSAPRILGAHLLSRDRKILYRLARSTNLWERRIAIVSTLGFITHNDFTDTLRLAEILMTDNQDLIHKATGWMLREVGKRSRPTLSSFLDRHAAMMPRTMLRYALEHYPQKERIRYMATGRAK